MDIEQVLHDFAVAGDNLPKDSIRWALEHWDVAAPRFARLIDDLVQGRDDGDAAVNAAFYIFHLLGEKRECAQFKAMCELLKNRELAERVLDEAITATLREILIAAFDGDTKTLRDLIEHEEADEFVRSAAMEALGYLAFSGAAPGFDMRAYLLELFAHMRPRGPSFVWAIWAIQAAHHGFGEFADKVDWLIARGFLDDSVLTREDFDRDLERVLADPTGRAGFEYDRVAPFTDTIGVLSTWYGFSEKAKSDRAEAEARRAAREFERRMEGPAVNPSRDVGRNDPCPCGSGKKFKKCCLAA